MEMTKYSINLEIISLKGKNKVLRILSQKNWQCIQFYFFLSKNKKIIKGVLMQGSNQLLASMAVLPWYWVGVGVYQYMDGECGVLKSSNDSEDLTISKFFGENWS